MGKLLSTYFRQGIRLNIFGMLLGIVALYLNIFALGLYVHSLESERLEVDAAEILFLMTTKNNKIGVSRISEVQARLIPVEPNIFDPESIFNSMFGRGRVHPQVPDKLKSAVVSLRSKLSFVDLEKARLDGISLVGADLSNSNLRMSNLSRSNLSYAKLKGADFSYSILSGAIFAGPGFCGARFAGVDFKGVHLKGLDLRNGGCREADLRGADLTGVLGWKGDFVGSSF